MQRRKIIHTPRRYTPKEEKSIRMRVPPARLRMLTRILNDFMEGRRINPAEHPAKWDNSAWWLNKIKTVFKQSRAGQDKIQHLQKFRRQQVLELEKYQDAQEGLAFDTWADEKIRVQTGTTGYHTPTYGRKPRREVHDPKELQRLWLQEIVRRKNQTETPAKPAEE